MVGLWWFSSYPGTAGEMLDFSSLLSSSLSMMVFSDPTMRRVAIVECEWVPSRLMSLEIETVKPMGVARGDTAYQSTVEIEQKYISRSLFI